MTTSQTFPHRARGLFLGALATAAIIVAHPASVLAGSARLPAGGDSRLSNHPSVIVIDGTDGDDVVIVTATSAESGSYRVNDGPPMAFRGITSFTFNGGNGNDILRIINPRDGLFAPRAGISYNGGEQSGPPGDELDIVGGVSSASALEMGPGPDAGCIRHTHGEVTQSITFTGLEPVNDTVSAASLTFTAPAGATTVNIVNGPTVSGFTTTQINDGGTGVFELLNFANKTNVTVNAGTGQNIVTIDNPNPATGLTNLTVDTGGQAREIINAGTVALPGSLTLVNSLGPIRVTAGKTVTVPGVRMTAGGTVTINGDVSASSGFIGISAGGSITQASGATLSTSDLLLLGGGPATLQDPGNSVNSFAANVTDGVSYTNAGDMIIIQIGIGSFGTATGVTTTNKAINVATVNGTIGVNQPVSAGSSTVSIAAGSAAGQDKTLALNQSVTGNGGVTLTGDNMNLTNGSAAVNAGTAVAILRPSDPATLIDVGGADAAGTLGLTDAELDKVTAGVLRV
ncbi:MAG: hypothetical protein ACJ8KU_03370, partial [Chthoniobacterales bacterium]